MKTPISLRFQSFATPRNQQHHLSGGGLSPLKINPRGESRYPGGGGGGFFYPEIRDHASRPKL